MVSNSASATTPVTDGWGARGNTIEFGSNGKLTISANAKVQALGTDTMGEAVNVMGGGNTIINYGLISAVSAPAIWFQDLVVVYPMRSRTTASSSQAIASPATSLATAATAPLPSTTIAVLPCTAV